ncbi:MutH/Vsr/archaeal HJR-like endonuclease [Tokyovirus A1]|uniref:MutH/Vsr/archaeal HJR-like endonuclease n=1 Tax=Tokyovirus A1 TaxID=1826170 RepID=UPI0007A9707C|nr:MutH/Vsr/archaeal HJR-like endonuclease [Tokyovirus A1]BAU80161.1 MutH/Vsr/archaeal HJR-like endonuclease [Tokyovirus A1]
MPPRKTQEEVALIFEKKGCKLLSKYGGSNCNMTFQCFCGEEGTTSYSRLTTKPFTGCQECIRKKSGKMTHEEASNLFLRKGCRLSTEYKKAQQKLEFICSCGKKSVVASIYPVRREKWYGCPSCKAEGVKKTCLEKYGSTTPLQSPEIREKIIKGWKEKWGSDSPLGNPEIQKKCKKTLFENHGVHNTMESDEIKEKTRQRNIQKYGVRHPMKCETVKNKFKEAISKKSIEDKEKTKQKREITNLERHGSTNPMKNEEVIKNHKKSVDERYKGKPEKLENANKKCKETCMKKYGVSNPMKLKETWEKSQKTYKAKTGYDHPSQNPEVARKILKSSFRKKEFLMPSGTPFICQGFEPLALQLLLDEGIDEQGILSPSEQDIKILYNFQGKSHMYHPDIFIPSKNLLVEVKSSWTFGGCGGKKKDEAEKTLKKLAACREQGYNTRLYIFCKNNKLVSFSERISPQNYNILFE